MASLASSRCLLSNNFTKSSRCIRGTGQLSFATSTRPLSSSCCSSSSCLLPSKSIFGTDRQCNRQSSFSAIPHHDLRYHRSTITSWCSSRNHSTSTSESEPIVITTTNATSSFSSSTSFLSRDVLRDPMELKGGQCYDLAMQCLEEGLECDRRTKEDKAREQYQAAAEAKKGRAAGVAVVRTIGKQVRTDRGNGIHLDNDMHRAVPTTKQGWDDLAQKYVQFAAFVHGHAPALVRLGNEALEEARGDADDVSTLRDIYSHVMAYIPHETDTFDNDNGEGVNGDIWKALHSHNDNDDDDDVAARCLPPSPSLKRAATLYRLAGERGSSEGWFNLGHLLWTNPHQTTDTIPQSLPQLLPQSPDNNDSNDDNDDDISLLLNLPPNQTEAMKVFHKAMELGDADATYFLGAQYLSYDEDENESESDIPHHSSSNTITIRSKGLQLIRTAALELQHGGALHHLALFLRTGDETLKIPPCSNTTFQTHLDAACDEHNHAKALFLRGHCFYHGQDGYPQHYQRALDDFLKAADAGCADAAVSAGVMYYRGGFGGMIGGRDRRKAFELYQRAGEMGSVEGWRNVVACYATGQGVPLCKETAQYIARTMLPDD